MSDAFAALERQAQATWAALEARPRVRVGTDISGLAAGAGQVLDALRREVERRGLDVAVHAVGSLGQCYAEPLVDIQKPGGARVFYRNVTPEMVPQLVEDCLVGDGVRADLALGSLGDNAPPDVSRFEDMDAWRHQVRIATRNCGTIDPARCRTTSPTGGTPRWPRRSTR